MTSACSRLKSTTCSEEKRWKSIRAAGLASVTARAGSSISSKPETSIDQKTLPQARLSASAEPYLRSSQERKPASAAGE